MLKLNLKKGEAYKQKMFSNAEVLQEVNGQKVNIMMTINGSMVYQVKTINEQGYEMEVTYESLTMSMQLPQGTMEFSSDKKDNPDILSAILAEIKNKPFQIKITHFGKISEVRNIESLFEAAFNKFPNISEGQRGQIKAQLMKAYGAEAFKGNIEMIMAIYPDRPVAKGESWIIKTKIESGMSADMITSYRFSEEGPSDYVITGDSKIETADRDAYIESNGMAMKYDLKGDMSSLIRIDKTSGWIIEAKVKQTISGNVYFKGNAQMPDGMKIPMVMKNEMAVTN
jgi:hypothetical protein